MRGSELIKKVRLLAKDPAYDSYEELNQAYEEICEITNFYWLKKTREGVIEFKTGVSEYILDLSGLRSLLNVWVFGEPSGNYSWHPLIEVNQLRYEELRNEWLNNDGVAESSVPKYYKLEEAEPTLMTVTPAPDKDYSTKIEYSCFPEPLGPNSIPLVPVSYQRKLCILAAGYILRSSSNPSNRQLGLEYIFEARNSFSKIVRDSQPNRTAKLQPPQTRFIR